MSEIRVEVERAIENAERLNGILNAFLTIDREYALRRVEKLEGADSHGKLHGIPIAVKDNICTSWTQTTCASRILSGYRPQYDATAVERLNKAGAVVIGKTNMDEFAMGSSNENSAFGLVKNPWDIERVPGGSSGGSAAAVAAGIVRVALGSDTGGSVRQPAAFCGVVGIKPTYGRVSRYGLVAFGSSLDQIGVLGKKVRDVAQVLEVISGRDEKDATSADVRVPEYLKLLDRDIKGVKIGVPRLLFSGGLDSEVKSAVEKAIEGFASLGTEIVEIDLPLLKYGIAVYYIIATAEASSNLARYDGVRYGFRAEGVNELRQMYYKTREEGFGEEVKRRIMLGTYVLSSGYYDAYYAKAQKVRTLLKRDFQAAFDKCDCIVMPTSPTTAFRIGEKTDDPLSMYLSDIYTVTANLVGIPAISIPCGVSKESLPIGLQILGKYWAEDLLLNLSNVYETAFPLDAKPKVHVQK
ncbi:MAG: Asp-tRNA(Asn)/Glu-tRNA(Gln) amidotransferase subunit GatA [Pyrinomonadaceae bacterium]|nr:Asp-tRNA(Asn)/Glu-tRNA(Gln) amidotransferase subunit GatA [Pyrinomonadaceae bacterium]MCX7638840.1 Asp-tRNA(Asn)/Glu-tRNA(Gln) amidotransferase subunit GatA [Pyrinomonadaceae bacterium]MDW8305024.1 Asp-tRNA(Asn)/Glu-tRNA(Gln) amidotransferase subunit GatA [Acidobacteriota bacterium]